ncbi:hypothetical protein BDN70DRAFT_889258 [Pholiota conissans]|uniref:Uncharacterized protein n=1 Tax=Pholiota conissans TaxID=109636 RepID=A0A9P5YLK6_9AGAR|nr:hypothetical protein BDN70DRAFT_889258 [Pholiota conissans]
MDIQHTHGWDDGQTTNDNGRTSSIIVRLSYVIIRLSIVLVRHRTTTMDSRRTTDVRPSSYDTVVRRCMSVVRRRSFVIVRPSYVVVRSSSYGVVRTPHVVRHRTTDALHSSVVVVCPSYAAHRTSSVVRHRTNHRTTDVPPSYVRRPLSVIGGHPSLLSSYAVICWRCIRGSLRISRSRVFPVFLHCIPLPSSVVYL